MLTKEQAYQMALQHLQAKRLSPDIGELVIMDSITRGEDFGWMFFYETKRYVDGDTMDRLGGNAPIIIDKESETLVVPGSRLSAGDYIMLYKKYRPDIAAFKKACGEYVPAK